MLSGFSSALMSLANSTLTNVFVVPSAHNKLSFAAGFGFDNLLLKFLKNIFLLFA